MADITVNVTLDPFSQLGDTLALWVGTENTASLAASTPAGGRQVAAAPAWPGGGADRGGAGMDPAGAAPAGTSLAGYQAGQGGAGLGGAGWSQTPQRQVVDQYYPADKCCVLPVGVKSVGAAGNASTADEQLIGLADAPVGARNLASVATETAGQVELTWTLSPDV